MRQLYAIEYGAQTEEGSKASYLEVLIASSEEDAYKHALERAHRNCNKRHGWLNHWARTSIPYTVSDLVKFMSLEKQ